jgi:dolichyl-phosphate beta-glucosyltransferase
VAARDLFSRQVVTSIVFDVELIFLARRRGYRIAVVPIQWTDRRGSRMQARPGLAVRVAWDLFRIPLIHRDVSRAR